MKFAFGLIFLLLMNISCLDKTETSTKEFKVLKMGRNPMGGVPARDKIDIQKFIQRRKLRCAKKSLEIDAIAHQMKNPICKYD
ncbi:MAG: hypothetical protein IPF93_15770 [Saprospiraceae bacterium]|nr:hypothetical protein [Saprospiraceae bacterium]